MISTVDPDARHAHKTVQARQDGFKAHMAVEPDTGIITDCALTKAGGRSVDGQPVTEARVGLELLEGEDSPVRVLADTAYGSGEFRAELAERGHVDLVKPRTGSSGCPRRVHRRRFRCRPCQPHRDLPRRYHPQHQPHRCGDVQSRVPRLPPAGALHRQRRQ